MGGRSLTVLQLLLLSYDKSTKKNICKVSFIMEIWYKVTAAVAIVILALVFTGI